MKVQEIKNSPSFGMALTEGSQKVLKRIIQGQSRRKADKILSIAERLHKNSSNYDIHISSVDVCVSPKQEYYYSNSFRVFDFSDFLGRSAAAVLKALKRVERFVKKTNDLVPVNKKNNEIILQKLEKIFEEKSSYGFGAEYKEDIAFSLTKLASEKNGQKRMNRAIEQIAAIHEKAKANRIHIEFNNYDADIPTIGMSITEKENPVLRQYAVPFKIRGDLNRGLEKVNFKMFSLKVMSDISEKAVEPIGNFISSVGERIRGFVGAYKMSPEEISKKVDKMFS